MPGWHVCGHLAVMGAQGMTLCLQGEPGIKGDRGEPGQRGQNGIPVSPCPTGHGCTSTRLSLVLSGLESALPGAV